MTLEAPADTALDYEAALTQLQAIVARLEAGSTGLDESLARFEEGIRLLRHCYQRLIVSQHILRRC